MIRNNLEIIMAENQLRTSAVAKDTGISRTTLTALRQNKTQMVQLETVNTLCTYLKISVKDFFSSIPLEVNCKFDTDGLEEVLDPYNQTAEFSGTIQFTYLNTDESHIYCSGKVEVEDGYDGANVSISLDYANEDENYSHIEMYDLIKKFEISRPFQIDIKNKIEDLLTNQVIEELEALELNVSSTDLSNYLF